MNDVRALAQTLAPGKPARRRLWGVVAAVNTGPPSTLDVTVSGSNVPGLRYVDSLFSPTVGDVVTVEREGSDLVVAGRLATSVPTVGGGGSVGPYVFTQSSPASTWTINHTLGRHPGAVTVTDSAGNQVEGDVQFTSVSQVVLTFSGAFSGVAYLV